MIFIQSDVSGHFIFYQIAMQLLNCAVMYLQKYNADTKRSTYICSIYIQVYKYTSNTGLTLHSSRLQLLRLSCDSIHSQKAFLSVQNTSIFDSENNDTLFSEQYFEIIALIWKSKAWFNWSWAKESYQVRATSKSDRMHLESQCAVCMPSPEA